MTHVTSFLLHNKTDGAPQKKEKNGRMNEPLTYHGFGRNRLEEIVDDFRKGVGANFGSAHHGRVALHAFLPAVADALHGGHPRFRPVAFVVLVVAGTHGHFDQDLPGGFFGFFVDVGADGGPEGVDHVDDDGDQEEVEEELGVVGEDMGEVWMGFEIAEKGRDDAHFVDLGRGCCRCFAAAGSVMVVTFPIGILVQTRTGDPDILFCFSSFALVNSPGHDIVARSTLDLTPTGHAVATEDT